MAGNGILFISAVGAHKQTTTKIYTTHLMSTEIIILSVWLSISLVMGIFSITQRGYQDRMSPIEEGFKSLISFIKGFISWPVFFPLGLAQAKYKCKVIHKVSHGKWLFKNN